MSARYGYSLGGRTTSVQDARDNYTTFAFDGFDRPTRTSFADNSYEELAYDAAGNVASRRQRDGRATGYAYDGLDRLTAVYLPGDVFGNANRGYGYDLVGNMVSATTGGADYTTSVTFGYDALGRRTGETSTLNGGGSKAKTYAYDGAGNVTRLNLPETNLFFTYAYLADGALSQALENGGGVLASWTYDDLGRWRSRTYPNGTGQGQAFGSYSYLTQKTLTGGQRAATIGLSLYTPAD